MEKTGDDGGFKTFRVKELHPTFGAEIEGVDFPSPSNEQFAEILAAMAKVRWKFSTSTTISGGHRY